MTIAEQLNKLKTEYKIPQKAVAPILSLIAEDRRDFQYYILQLEKAHGPKWAERIKSQAAKDQRDYEEHEENEL